MIECQSTNYLMILLLMVVSGARTPLLRANEDEDEGVDLSQKAVILSY